MKENLSKFKNYLIVNGHSTLIYYTLMGYVLDEIKDITEENVCNFIIKRRKNNISPSTLNVYIKAIKTYLKFIKKDNIVLPKYFTEISKLPQFITYEYFEKDIIKQLHIIFPKTRLLKIKTLLYFMFYSGLRKMEIDILKRENFNFQTREVKVLVPKTKEERLIPLNERMAKLLKYYFKSEPEQNNAFNLNKGSINHIFKVLKSELENPKLHPHIFRHSFAMHLQRNGFTTREIMALLGHKNIRTTIRYENADIGLIKKKFSENIK